MSFSRTPFHARRLRMGCFGKLRERAINVDIGANPSVESADEDEGVGDQAQKVVDIVDTFRLQEQPSFDKKRFIAHMKKYIKALTPLLDGEKQEQFKKNIEGATKYLLPKLSK